MKKTLIALLLLLSFSFATEIIEYYGIGCPVCAKNMDTLDQLKEEVNFTVLLKEVYHDGSNNAELLELYRDYEFPIEKGGVPTFYINGKALLVGGLEKEDWKKLIELCNGGECPEGAHDPYTIKEWMEGREADIPSDTYVENGITWPLIISAAAADSVNPCTLAILTILVGSIVMRHGKKGALSSGLVFVGIVYISYVLIGLGIINALVFAGITELFYVIVALAALGLTIKELRCYLENKGESCPAAPGIIDKYINKIVAGEISLVAIILVAIFCSFILLPCSSGPYLVILGLLAERVTTEYIGYLLIYNFIFVLPMLFVVGLVYYGYHVLENLEEKKSKYMKHMHLFSAIIMFLLFLIIIFDLISRL